MTTTRAKIPLHPLQALASLFIALTIYVYTACSNSEPVGSNGDSDSPIIEYLPLNDTEYPYAGIPRIVIETENHRAIKDRETEIPAKLQIWGEKNPESEITDLTIRGRGNSSWVSMPQKSYKIEFKQKQNLLGLPQNRDWALISDYADKTLMKNYLAFHLSESLKAYYTPRCKFIELYINGEYLGVYLLTETIKIGKNRVNIPQNDNSYIVEFDSRATQDEQYFTSYILNDSLGKKFLVHSPKNASTEALSTINEHIKNFELFLKDMKKKGNYEINHWLDIDEYVKHYWVQEFSKNPDAHFSFSVFFSWKKGDVIRMGPVWDFDLSFGGHSNKTTNSPIGWHIRHQYWNQYLIRDSLFNQASHDFWVKNKETFISTLNTIDSIHAYLQKAADNNFKKWNILSSTKKWYHPRGYHSYDETIDSLKTWINQRIQWIDAYLP